MEGNPFLNYFWQSAIELPAYIVGKYLSKFNELFATNK
jgi:hypothetical protein